MILSGRSVDKGEKAAASLNLSAQLYLRKADVSSPGLLQTGRRRPGALWHCQRLWLAPQPCQTEVPLLEPA
jgi:hypothetical protein